VIETIKLSAALPPRDDKSRPALGWLGGLKTSFALIGDRGPAGRMLRLILPMATLIMGVSGLAILAAHRFQFLGTATSLALFGAIAAILVLGVALRAAWLLNAEHAEVTRLHRDMVTQALQDPETGLANRTHFLDQLARRAALADRRTSMPFAVCSLELDGIGEAAAQSGEGTGRQLLAKTAEVIRDCLRASDLIARLEGDTFGILLQEISDARDVDILARRIVSAIPPALTELAAGAPPIAVSIGIVMKKSGRDSPGDVLREAEAAQRVAKRRGPGRFELTAFAD
jgi:diguanylate cyclase (GGDEF)-like protein